IADVIYDHRGSGAVRHVFRVASALDALVLGEAQILGQLKAAYRVAGGAGTSGPVLGRCLERAFGVAKRVRTETAIARGAANVSTVAVDLAKRVFGDLTGKSVLVIGAGKMSRLAARHLYASGAQRIVVTNRSPEKAEALAAEIDGVAQPWEDLEGLLVDADVVISSTGARQPILTKPLFKRVTKARRWRQLVVIDIAVPRDAEPEIGELDGVYVFDIDDLEKVVAANLAERAKAAEHAGRIVEHEAGQFEHWMRTQGVVPTIRALRERFARVAEGELQKSLDQLARREHTPAQQREVMQRLVQLVVNKLLHQPTAALREAPPEEAGLRAEVLCQLFDLSPSDAEEPREPQQALDREIAEPPSERKAVT
ncbi:MAG: glutamyl-tRNA reductase, partial [Myxococcales bacterium]|nr:glutamyl-tRNA reductase [Myxococcales bacterium]